VSHGGLRLRRTYVGFLFCPSCGEWREPVAATNAEDEDKNRCRVCGYDFGEVTDSMRLDKRVLAAVCPACGTEIHCTEENTLSGVGGVRELFCPRCRQIIARQLNGRWVGVEEALRSEKGDSHASGSKMMKAPGE
jgi:predicted RNA-binding Zn-ribbon protein involved in translation (DUF1610 family)